MEELAVKAYMEYGLLFAIGLVFIWMMVRSQNMQQEFIKKVGVLDKIYEALKPTTFAQAKDLCDLVTEKCKYRSLDILIDAQKHATTHQSIDQENINRKLESLYDGSRNTLQRFNYSGKSLDKYMDTVWWLEVSKVIFEEINSSKDYDRSRKNIFGVFERVYNEIEQGLNSN